MKIQAVIFDMDGLLIDSEPYWRDSEVSVLGALGVPLTHEMCAQFAGLRIREVVDNWRSQYPWEGESSESVAGRIQLEVCERIRGEGELLPGARELVGELHQRGYPLAVATSSDIDVVDAVMERSGLGPCFNIIASASAEQYGKPHPAVFLRAAEELGINPLACLVLEDALLGVIAARAARMRVVAVPEAWQRSIAQFSIADRVIDSLERFWEDAGEMLE
jgi:sugar-phosphatase